MAERRRETETERDREAAVASGISPAPMTTENAEASAQGDLPPLGQLVEKKRFSSPGNGERGRSAANPSSDKPQIPHLSNPQAEEII